jgi:hypothetical protein
MAPRIDPPGIYTSSTISRPQSPISPYHYECEYCGKPLEKGIIKNYHAYCNLRCAILGALTGNE